MRVGVPVVRMTGGRVGINSAVELRSVTATFSGPPGPL